MGGVNRKTVFLTSFLSKPLLLYSPGRAGDLATEAPSGTRLWWSALLQVRFLLFHDQSARLRPRVDSGVCEVGSGGASGGRPSSQVAGVGAGAGGRLVDCRWCTSWSSLLAGDTGLVGVCATVNYLAQLRHREPPPISRRVPLTLLLPK